MFLLYFTDTGIPLSGLVLVHKTCIYPCLSTSIIVSTWENEDMTSIVFFF